MNLALEIRTFGDPVLKSAAPPVENFDKSLSRLAEKVTCHIFGLSVDMRGDWTMVKKKRRRRRRRRKEEQR